MPDVSLGHQIDFAPLASSGKDLLCLKRRFAVSHSPWRIAAPHERISLSSALAELGQRKVSCGVLLDKVLAEAQEERQCLSHAQ